MSRRSRALVAKVERHLGRFPDDLVDDGPCYDFKSAVENLHDLTVEIDRLKRDRHATEEVDWAMDDRHRALRRAATTRVSCARRVARRGGRLIRQAKRIPELPDEL